MTTNMTHKKIRIFVASPGDVAKERKVLASVVEQLNLGLADKLGFILEIREWSQVAPGMGRPEDVILAQIPVQTWDVFIGILWLRFGSPTGGSQGGRKFESGTEEEFHLAYKAWKMLGRPNIMFYRCIRGSTTLKDFDFNQFGRVAGFFEGFNPESEHSGLYKEFRTTGEFREIIRQDLESYIFQYSEKLAETTGGSSYDSESPDLRYHLEITIPPSGNIERDMASMGSVLRLVSGYHGEDTFSLIIPRGSARVQIDFPADRTKVNKLLIRQLEYRLGPNTVRVVSKTSLDAREKLDKQE